ncbi:hypothetical protein P170DRAFT_396592 [Aspergillus steynii IBT 23096]|uniref:Methyltransferase type 11 domain-containing protein n=1 Tax=Aspergillus steynii IBT 23096 TaxID=1392250 RepID=A0A2I2GSK0_9EURO|nr:uncharacterized protein P170DRAFT_396592 [Aspergillus steynii IBT 23096]PLB55859.1 hypothetical protein P170DRAFT_396592 [Aspergillus steynii IBT 23096]
MSSHKSDGGRIPRLRGVASQPRSVSSPMITAPAKQTGLPGSVPPRAQIGPPLPSNRTSRVPSLSVAEKGQLGARSNPSRIPSSQGLRSFLPPRSTTHPLPAPSGPTVSPGINANLGVPQSSYSVSISSNNSPPLSARSRPRNVLRRKAPTIGQHTTEKPPATMEIIKPEKLNVIIPDDAQSSNGNMHCPQPFASPKQRDQLYSTPSAVRERNVSGTPDKVSYGPKELASLRTTLNTQNLPPPTPSFASASSPSTRYSGSPGIWSRTSTPTSLSSYSPGIVQPVKAGSRLRQPSPSQTRPPTFSPRMQQTPSPSNPMSSGEFISPVSTQGADSTSSLTRLRQSGLVTEPDAGRDPSTNSSIPQRKTSIKSSLPRRSSGLAESSRSAPDPKSSNIESRGPLKRGGLSLNTAQVPRRPSREGTHQLELEPSPVVQSNLSPETVTGHKRRGSVESSLTIEKSPLSVNQSAATSVDSLHSRTSSRIPSRLPPSPELSRKPPQTVTRDSKTPQTPVSPGKPRRFGLFSKKSKPELDTKSSDEIRPTRKGPAAGTGHEGYGRYGQRGRKASVGSTGGARDRSTSTTRSVSKSVSSSKGSDRGRSDFGLDDFLLHRLEPVIIPGGGIDGAALIRTQSEQSSSGVSTTSTTNMAPRSKISQSPVYSTDSLATSTGTVEKARDIHQRNISQVELNHDQVARGGSSSLHSTGGSGLKPERKISQADGIRHERSQASTLASSPESKASNNTKKQEKKSPKKGLGLKWSFFHRSNDSTANKEPEPLTSPVPQLQAAISTVKSHRPVAHYAFVDTDSDPLEEIIHNIEDSPPTEDDGVNSPVEIPAALNIRKPSPSILLPSPPKLQGEFTRNGPPSPKVYFTRNPFDPSPQAQAEPVQDKEQFLEKRTSRLASIGRIPRVVSRRERQHRPAFQSFSRPFSVAESPSLTAPVDRPAEFSPPRPTPESQRPKPPRDRHNPAFDLTQPFGDPTTTQSILDFIAGPYSKHEFLTFSPGNDSMISTSSGSESLAAVTAVIPNPESELNEDEVWGEYDDLIDHVLSPETTRSVSPGENDAEGKLELATMASRALQAELNGQADKRVRSSLIDNPALALTPASPQSSNGSVHLRRSRIVSALHSSIAPSSQPSFSDIIKAYCDDQPEGEALDQIDQATIVPTNKQSLYPSSPLNPSPSFETCRQRNTILFDIAERDREGPTAQTNIRSGSLMTSRWLSFGRVLFSPAHNHVKDGEDERILVVDGLGNDDWSFYCALTYPNAEVHCLTDGPAPATFKHPAAWQPPSNHHTIHHASLEDQFPFPKGSFTVTVLRFPAACSESAQNKIVSECKRVLRPGGYIEMSVLDLDMVNMGIRTRKAVRQLKERTYLTDPNISLKPASDSIQRMLGQHGFDSLRRCVVRIPTAGIIVRSSASSSSTSSSNPSTMATNTTPFTVFSGPSTSSVSAQSKAHGKSSSNDTDLSLGDLLSDPSPSPANDESIRKIVAKVGRWWYTRCYEIPVLPNGDADLSIWADRKVLRECQKRGTGFRLLIAYSQKPSEKRRTASV